jgi:hypothetical protein
MDVIGITQDSPKELHDAGIDTIAHAFAKDPVTLWPKAMANATNLDVIEYNRLGFGLYFEQHVISGASALTFTRSET